MSVSLSFVERWILLNQYEILAALCPDEADTYSRYAEALRAGYEFHYGEMSQHIARDGEGLSYAECKEVFDILEMFNTLARSYDALVDKSGVMPRQMQFRGFDGNSETKYLMYARYYCDQPGGRFPRLDCGDDFNSHEPMLDRYRAMLSRWRLLAKERKYELSKGDIQSIIAA